MTYGVGATGFSTGITCCETGDSGFWMTGTIGVLISFIIFQLIKNTNFVLVWLSWTIIWPNPMNLSVVTVTLTY